MFNIDFEEWSKLYQTNPEAFEKKRLETLKAFIDQNAVNETTRLRLEQTLFCVEMTRKRAKSPLQGAIEASNLMWESVDKLQTHTHELSQEINNFFQPGNHLRLITTTPNSCQDQSFNKSTDQNQFALNSNSSKAQVLQFKKQAGSQNH